MDPDPVCPERLDPDPICPERLDSDLVNIRPDPNPRSQDHFFFIAEKLAKKTRATVGAPLHGSFYLGSSLYLRFAQNFVIPYTSMHGKGRSPILRN